MKWPCTDQNGRAGFRGDDGTAALEFGLIAPFLILLVVGVVEFGSSFYQAMQAQNAAEAGAIYASKYGFNTTGIGNAVGNATQSAGITANPAPSQFCGCPAAGGITEVSCSATCGTGGAAPGQYVRISAAIAHTPLMSLSGTPLSETITREAIIRVY